MAAVEDHMWFYRALHTHVERALAKGLAKAAKATATPVDWRRRNFASRFQILDAGCGTGGLIRRLERRHPDWQWTGVDVEPLACELSRSRVRLNDPPGFTAALPFPDSAFDAVVCSDVLYHLDDDVAALREMFRVLRPGGIVIINVPAHQWLWSYHDVTVHGRRRYDRRSWSGNFSKRGSNQLSLTHWNALPLPLVIVRRKLLPASVER